MNSTSNTTSAVTESDPWVESGALVYVAITVVVSAAVIMCCSWFLVHNETTKRCCETYCGRKKRYTEVDDDDDEEEIELNGTFDGDTFEEAVSKNEAETFEDEHGKLEDDTSAFTIDDASSSGAEDDDELIAAAV